MQLFIVDFNFNTVLTLSATATGVLVFAFFKSSVNNFIKSRDDRMDRMDEHMKNQDIQIEKNKEELNKINIDVIGQISSIKTDLMKELGKIYTYMQKSSNGKQE